MIITDINTQNQTKCAPNAPTAISAPPTPNAIPVQNVKKIFDRDVAFKSFNDVKNQAIQSLDSAIYEARVQKVKKVLYKCLAIAMVIAGIAFPIIVGCLAWPAGVVFVMLPCFGLAMTFGVLSCSVSTKPSEKITKIISEYIGKNYGLGPAAHSRLFLWKNAAACLRLNNRYTNNLIRAHEEWNALQHRDHHRFNYWSIDDDYYWRRHSPYHQNDFLRRYTPESPSVSEQREHDKHHSPLDCFIEGAQKEKQIIKECFDQILNDNAMLDYAYLNIPENERTRSASIFQNAEFIRDAYLHKYIGRDLTPLVLGYLQEINNS